ncbi:deoxyhypusine synthase family protein [bacterium]|nr:deoxyhypusine synthase family protein [bacterium]
MDRMFHSGQDDGLEPLRSLNLENVNRFSDLLKQMSDTAFGGRELGHAYHVLLKMIQDPDCQVVFTMSGAMTIAKMGKIVCDMIEQGVVHYVLSTGAIMAHGLTESIGCLHYKYDPSMNDDQLYQWGYNRVYDTLEKEESLTEAEHIISRVLQDYTLDDATCSHRITHAIGKYLCDNGHMPSILGCAYKNHVPVYIPAFTDSEFGLNIATHLMAQKKHPKEASLDTLFSDVPRFNPYHDLYNYAGNICKAKKLGIITIGGGVPRNWGQQIGPFIDIINLRIGTELKAPRFHYGVRICPEPVHWGGLSGCTYSEGMSWGKFIPREKGGDYAEVHCDATIAWPLLIKAVLESIN